MKNKQPKLRIDPKRIIKKITSRNEALQVAYKYKIKLLCYFGNQIFVTDPQDFLKMDEYIIEVVFRDGCYIYNIDRHGTGNRHIQYKITPRNKH